MDTTQRRLPRDARFAGAAMVDILEAIAVATLATVRALHLRPITHLREAELLVNEDTEAP